jgi:hypothetical protein
MAHHYSDPKRESDPTALPNVEVYYLTAEEAGNDEDGDPVAPNGGWFYAFGFPGCMHDGEPMGPFDTEAEALADAREGLTDDDEPAPPDPNAAIRRTIVVAIEIKGSRATVESATRKVDARLMDLINAAIAGVTGYGPDVIKAARAEALDPEDEVTR